MLEATEGAIRIVTLAAWEALMSLHGAAFVFFLLLIAVLVAVGYVVLNLTKRR